MHRGHEVVRCSCGTVIAQCRCFGLNKLVTTVEKGCGVCQAVSAALELLDVRWADGPPCVPTNQHDSRTNVRQTAVHQVSNEGAD
jgi:hypothetical protein